jgi:hypothetical protein
MPEKNNKINGPSSNYKNSKIVFFSSFAEEEEYNLKKNAEQNPVERIRETVQLILRVYGYTEETLRSRQRSNKIFIDKK